jgi:hypothetical protein
MLARREREHASSGFSLPGEGHDSEGVRSLRNVGKIRTFSQRVYTTVPRGHWETATSISTLRPDGLAAPFMPDGPITANGSSPMSKKCFPGDNVLIDNLASHKSLRISKAIEAMGAERTD